MNRSEYRSLSTEKRITYLNSRMEAGELQSHICKEIGIANNIAVGFNKKGYFREGPLKLYVYHEPQHPGQMDITDQPDQEEQETIISNEGITIDSIDPGNEPIETIETEPIGAQEATESEEATIMPENENKPTEGQPVTPEQTEQPKRMGRPPRLNDNIKKLTIEIDQDVYKALMHYKIDNGIFVNALLEELIKEFLNSGNEKKNEDGN